MVNSRIVAYGRVLPGIHGLRGTAAFSIVLFHLIHVGGVPVPEYLSFIKRDFGYAVHLFFVLSAYSLMHSTLGSAGKSNWVAAYLVKRFFRIAPLFYLLLAFELTRQAWFGGVRAAPTDVLLNLTFAFGAVPFSGLVWGGWSIGVEMVFYAIFPVLLLAIRSFRSALLLVSVGMLVSYAARAALHRQHLELMPAPPYDWSYFSPASNLAFFCMGIFAFFAAQAIEGKGAGSYCWAMAPIASIVLVVLVYADPSLYFADEGGVRILLWGWIFVGLTVWQSVRPSYPLANVITEYLGERSFSIYLIHPVVITFWKVLFPDLHRWVIGLPAIPAFILSAALVMTVVLVVSEFTYRYVEVPGISFSRRIGRRVMGDSA